MDTEPENILELKDAIIELYLAIKIRSTEEVSRLIAWLWKKKRAKAIISLEILDFLIVSLYIARFNNR